MDDKLRQFLDAAQAAYGDSGAQAAARALEWTKAKHGAAVRASGEPAWAHDLRVAETLLGMGMDLDSVLAGLVHDTCEGRGGVDDSEPQTLPPADLEFGPEPDGAVEDKAGASDALA
ncbi:MAG: HD domain-containing protein, partial [Rectinemataceae bacterium]